MSQLQFGPINITQGNPAKFVVKFLDSAGQITEPTFATLSVIYTTVSNSSQTDAVTLASVGSFWNGTWPSSQAALGLADWSVAADGASLGIEGMLRIIGPGVVASSVSSGSSSPSLDFSDPANSQYIPLMSGF